MQKLRKVGILGSTGSIGESTLQVIRHLKDSFKITSLAACSNIDKLEEQAREFQPEIIGVYDREKANELKKRLPNCKIVSGSEGLKEAAAHSSADIVVSAIVGTAGLAPTIAAISSGKHIALANKEALVSGGNLVVKLAKEKNVSLLPVDSEHSAIFQCLHGQAQDSIGRIILTASGGPFLHYSKEQLKNISLKDALNHPNWKMGPKITVDCSTLMNKGLEMIEAHFLFGQPAKKIDVVIHPQSIIHSMVEFVDGSMKAQMSVPSMVIPIQYALTFPERMPGLIKPFDFIQHGRLEFVLPDLERFRCLRLAYISLEVGKSMPCYMNACNEVLVKRFLNGELHWSEIAEKLEQLMLKHEAFAIDSLDAVFEAERIAHIEAENI